MKLPIDAETYINALHYAQLSVGKYTHYHAGWDNNEARQFRRILSGRVAQSYVTRLLHVNGVEVEEDESEFTQSDSFDFKVKSLKFDVKSSSHTLMPMQVTLPTKRKKPDYFIFCRLDKALKSIAIVGVVRASEVLQDKFFVKKGDLIPNTDLIQTFEEGSYFYTGLYKPISELIGWAVSSPVPYERHTEHPAIA